MQVRGDEWEMGHLLYELLDRAEVLIWQRTDEGHSLTVTRPDGTRCHAEAEEPAWALSAALSGGRTRHCSACRQARPATAFAQGDRWCKACRQAKAKAMRAKARRKRRPNGSA